MSPVTSAPQTPQAQIRLKDSPCHPNNNRLWPAVWGKDKARDAAWAGEWAEAWGAGKARVEAWGKVAEEEAEDVVVEEVADKAWVKVLVLGCAVVITRGTSAAQDQGQTGSD